MAARRLFILVFRSNGFILSLSLSLASFFLSFPPIWIRIKKLTNLNGSVFQHNKTEQHKKKEGEKNKERNEKKRTTHK